MTQSSSPSIGFAFALQSAKGSPVTNAADFRRMRAVSAMVGSQQAMDQLPQEVGGGYHSSAMFKQFVAGVGAAQFLPRLEGDLAYLITSTLGSPRASGEDLGDGVYKTIWDPANDYCTHPWLTARKYIPTCETDVSTYMAEEISDAKAQALNFTLAAGSPAMANFSLLAINSAFVDGATASDWPDEMQAYEDTDSVIMGSVTGTGALLKAITGVDLGEGAATDFGIPAINLQVGITNRFSGEGVRPELVLGKLGMDDLVLLEQTMAFQLTYKWKNPSLYKAVYAYQGSGNAVSTSPTSQPLTTEVEITMRSPRFAGSSSSVYEELKIKLAECTIDCPQGVVLTGGQFVTMTVTGIAKIQNTPSEYATIELVNGEDYTDLGVTYS